LSELIATLFTELLCPSSGLFASLRECRRLLFYKFENYKFDVENYMYLMSECDRLVYSNYALFRLAYGMYILEKSYPENPYFEAFNIEIALLADAFLFLSTSLDQSLSSIYFELLTR
jgi:hypothetical protein